MRVRWLPGLSSLLLDWRAGLADPVGDGWRLIVGRESAPGDLLSPSGFQAQLFGVTFGRYLFALARRAKEEP